MIQIGARNMQNFTLLAEVGRSGAPALLKRGLSSTLEELLMAAEYVLKEGNESVMLCERGIRTFETAYRFTLDLMAVPVLKELSHLPVIVDPSHAAGRRDLVMPAVAGGSAPPEPTGSSSRSTPARGGDLRRPPAAGGRRVRRLSGKGFWQRQPWLVRRSRARPLRIAVVGVGLIGGSIALAARELLDATVAGFDLSVGALDTARERGCWTGSPTRCAEPVGGCRGGVRGGAGRGAPASCRRGARRRATRLRGDRVGSTKRAVVAAHDDARFVGGHPLAGAENAGVEQRGPIFSRARPGT